MKIFMSNLAEAVLNDKGAKNNGGFEL
jgi:hypothetical protein